MHNFSIVQHTARENLRRAWWRLYFGWRDLWRFVYTRIIPIAIQCDWCGRLLPVEFKKLPNHLRFWGRYHQGIVLCDSCDKRESIWDSFWGDDEDYDDDGDSELEITETSFARYLVADAKGHLAISEVSGYKYSGQDWGETVDQWDESAFPLLNARRPFLKGLIKAVRAGDVKLPRPGGSIDLTGFDEDEYE